MPLSPRCSPPPIWLSTAAWRDAYTPDETLIDDLARQHFAYVPFFPRWLVLTKFEEGQVHVAFSEDVDGEEAEPCG